MSTMPVAAPGLEGVDVAPKKRGLLIPIVIGVVVLAALGAGVWFFVMPRFAAPADAKPAAPKEQPVKATVPLGAVVVNLKGEARRYLRVNVSLGLPRHEDGKEI